MNSKGTDIGPLEQVFRCATARIIDAYTITAGAMSIQIVAEVTGITERRTSDIIKLLHVEGILVLAEPSKKNRLYKLNHKSASVMSLRAFCDKGNWRHQK